MMRDLWGSFFARCAKKRHVAQEMRTIFYFLHNEVNSKNLSVWRKKDE